MENQTISLEEAAKFLGFKSTERLRLKAYHGIIPGFKAGRSWMFYMPDLIDYIREQYTARREATQVDIIGGKTCQSAKRKEGVISIQSSRSVGSELMNLRKQIREQRRESMRKNEDEK